MNTNETERKSRGAGAARKAVSRQNCINEVRRVNPNVQVKNFERWGKVTFTCKIHGDYTNRVDRARKNKFCPGCMQEEAILNAD